MENFWSNEYIDENTVAMTRNCGPITHTEAYTKQYGEPYLNDDIKKQHEISRQKQKELQKTQKMHLPTKKKVEYVPKTDINTRKKYKKHNKYKKRKKQKRPNALQTQSIKKPKRKSKVPRKKTLSYKIRRALDFKVKYNLS